MLVVWWGREYLGVESDPAPRWQPSKLPSTLKLKHVPRQVADWQHVRPSYPALVYIHFKGTPTCLLHCPTRGPMVDTCSPL
jgi:hypothetical protein